MRYVAAALLTAMGGGEINKKNIKNLLDVVGIECDEDKINKVVEELKGKNIEELLEEGSKKLASMPAAGAAPAGGGKYKLFLIQMYFTLTYHIWSFLFSTRCCWWWSSCRCCQRGEERGTRRRI